MHLASITLTAKCFLQNGPAYCEAFLNVLRNVTKEEAVQYVLALIDDMLSGRQCHALCAITAQANCWWPPKSITLPVSVLHLLQLILLEHNCFIRKVTCIWQTFLTLTASFSGRSLPHPPPQLIMHCDTQFLFHSCDRGTQMEFCLCQ